MTELKLPVKKFKTTTLTVRIKPESEFCLLAIDGPSVGVGIGLYTSQVKYLLESHGLVAPQDAIVLKDRNFRDTFLMWIPERRALTIINNSIGGTVRLHKASVSKLKDVFDGV